MIIIVASLECRSHLQTQPAVAFQDLTHALRDPKGKVIYLR